MDNGVFMLGFVICCVSQFISLIVILLFICIPKLRKHPGQFIFIQSLLQYAYDLHWILSFGDISKKINSQICEWIGGLSILFYNIGLVYTVVLGLELLVKFSNISNIAYYKRTLFYHFLAISVTLGIEVCIAASSGFGLSHYNTCSCNSFTSEIIEDIPRLTALVCLLVITALVAINVRKPYTKVIFNYCLTVFSMILTWCVPGILLTLYFFNRNPVFLHVGYILGCLSGTIVGCSRLIDNRIYREVYKMFLSKTQRREYFVKKKKFLRGSVNNLSSMTEKLIKDDVKVGNSTSINCFSDIFENLSKKIKLEILSTLFVYFSQTQQNSDETETSKDKSKGIAYTADDFAGLEYVLKDSELRYCITHIVKAMSLIFMEFRPLRFQKIRQELGHSSETLADSFYDQLLVSYDSAKVIQNPTNNSMVMMTSDQKYVIKTISKQERRIFFQFLLEPYTNRILSCADSRLIRILGVFRIVTSKLCFIVMENTAADLSSDLVFDLKGSSVDRFVKTEDGLIGKVLKDENFRVLGQKVKISPFEANKIVAVVKEDLRILKEIGIMDYSILLVVNGGQGDKNRYSVGKGYRIAVIDLFQVYDGKKAVERWFKIWVRRVDRKGISVVSPKEYFERLVRFLEESFVVNEVELSEYL